MSASDEAKTLLKKIDNGRTDVSIEEVKDIYMRSVEERAELSVNGDFVKSLTIGLALSIDEARDAVETVVRTMPLGTLDENIVQTMVALTKFDNAMNNVEIQLTELVIAIREERGELKPVSAEV